MSLDGTRGVRRARAVLPRAAPIVLCVLLALLRGPDPACGQTPPNNSSQSGREQNLTYASLPRCELRSAEYRNCTFLPLQPCVLYDTAWEPDYASAPRQHGDVELTMVQVTPSQCADGRDGPVTAVRKINADNGGRGFGVGYNQSRYVRFRLVSVVAGVLIGGTDDAYAQKHRASLRALLRADSGLNAAYVVGSCSFAAELELSVIAEFRRITLAQVGPDDFYAAASEFVFGIHISSREYTRPALQGIAFRADALAGASSSARGNSSSAKAAARPSVAVLSRAAPVFFRSTCEAAVAHGFTAGRVEFFHTIRHG